MARVTWSWFLPQTLLRSNFHYFVCFFPVRNLRIHLNGGNVKHLFLFLLEDWCTWEFSKETSRNYRAVLNFILYWVSVLSCFSFFYGGWVLLNIFCLDSCLSQRIVWGHTRWVTSSTDGTVIFISVSTMKLKPSSPTPTWSSIRPSPPPRAFLPLPHYILSFPSLIFYISTTFLSLINYLSSHFTIPFSLLFINLRIWRILHGALPYRLTRETQSDLMNSVLFLPPGFFFTTFCAVPAILSINFCSLSLILVISIAFLSFLWLLFLESFL